MRIPWQDGIDERTLPRAQMIIRAFYAFLVYLAAQAAPDFGGLTRVRELHGLWPVAWLEWLPPGQGAMIVVLFFLGAAILGAIAPGSRAVRVTVFLALLEYVALRNSEGKIGHSLHLPVLIALVLIFLPRNWHRAEPGSEEAIGTALVLRAAQAVVLLTYTMSGLGKLGAGTYELVTGQISSFHPSGFPRIIAARLLETGSESALGSWIINQPSWLTWPLFPGVIYFQTFAIVAAFRPALHQLWGTVLILFHFGNSFLLTIYFPHSIFLLALLLLASPFAPPRFDVGTVLAELPILSALRRVAMSRMSPPPAPVNASPAPGPASE